MSETITTNHMATRPADAMTIISQIGHYTLALVGATHMVDLGDGLMFKARVGHLRNVKIIVKLAANDTYTVELVRLNGQTLDAKSVAVAEHVYCDQLSAVIREMLGV